MNPRLEYYNKQMINMGFRRGGVYAHRETDIDKEVTAAASDESSRGGREKDGNLGSENAVRIHHI
jgi:hypothetical protein